MHKNISVPCLYVFLPYSTYCTILFHFSLVPFLRLPSVICHHHHHHHHLSVLPVLFNQNFVPIQLRLNEKMNRMNHLSIIIIFFSLLINRRKKKLKTKNYFVIQGWMPTTYPYGGKL